MMLRNRKNERRSGRVTQGVLAGLAMFGLYMIFRELPAARRYLRMERM